jgi:hypothetical protein
MKLQTNHASHLPVLIELTSKTTGPILELGCGLFSTTYLFWVCEPFKRKLVSYESNPEYFEYLKTFDQYNIKNGDRFHQIHLVKNYDKADLTGPWSIALVDHAPDSRRAIDIERLSDEDVEYVVVHDAESTEDAVRKIPFSKCAELFKYSFKYETSGKPHTLILSNTHSLGDFDQFTRRCKR